MMGQTLHRRSDGASQIETSEADLRPATAVSEAALNDRVIRHRMVEVDGLQIFYREAGRVGAPTILLLHGFPSSSFMFRSLMPALAGDYHLIAPDYPGFGNSAFPGPGEFPHSFSALTTIIDRFTNVISLDRYILYIQDYGAPVGLRLALLHPQKVIGLIVQNGNAYEEGLSGEWEPLRAYWREPTSANREKLRGWLTPDGIRLQYVAGLPEGLIERVSPETWILDWARLSRPGNVEYQLDLFGDYRSNVELYPRFQQFFRDYRPPTLVAWGRYDPFFTTAGATAFQRDIPDAETHLLDAGHFALETHDTEIAALVRSYFGRLSGARGE
jgi:pimeloyl-ACP methyl ester carboxylesterase